LSTLTKICVVLLVVLVLFACPVFIQKALFDVNWRAYGEGQRTRANVAETTLRNQVLAAQRWQREYEEERRRAQDMAQHYQGLIDDRSGEVGRLARELSATQARMNELTFQLKVQQSTMDGLVKQNAAVTAQLEAQRKLNIDLGDRLRRSEDQNKEYVILLETAEKQVKVLKGQLDSKEGEIKEYLGKIKQLEEDLARATAGAAPGAAPAERAVPTAEKIEGEVLAVKGDLASLNVGAASGVKQGTVFIIYRENFIAHLRVADVSASTCAGVVYDRVGEVRQGDKVTTRLD